MYYILENKVPVKIYDIEEWAVKSTVESRRVDETFISDVRISTVFLGLDHSFGEGEPLLFETMIFGGEHDDYQDRYSTWDEAVAGHERAVNLCIEIKDEIKNGSGLKLSL